MSSTKYYEAKIVKMDKEAVEMNISLAFCISKKKNMRLIKQNQG